MLNEAAESYFGDGGSADFLLNKPYSDVPNLSRHLVNAGILIEALDLQPGDTVVELGAGSCWLSHILNLMGCRTVAVDVSPTALAIGRRLFERDSRTNWGLEPRFERYDGHTLPLTAGSVDRIVVNDAFHHVPNPGDLLAEMSRVLNADGVVVMNTGDTTWLHHPEKGCTRLGAHLEVSRGEGAELAAHDWLRADLPRDVPPGEEVEILVTMPPIPEPGRYSAVFDMVVEGVTWFADRGSEPARAELLIV